MRYSNSIQLINKVDKVIKNFVNDNVNFTDYSISVFYSSKSLIYFNVSIEDKYGDDFKIVINTVTDKLLFTNNIDLVQYKLLDTVDQINEFIENIDNIEFIRYTAL